MATQFLLRRSDVPNKRPDPAFMATGALNLNYDPVSGGVFYKDSAGDLVKLGPAQVSATAPNVVPVGEAGNSLGEFWYDTSINVLKIWNGTAWVESGSANAFSLTEGTSVPANSSGVDGDLFLLTSSNPQVIYQKVSGTWVTNRVLTDMATNAAYNQSRLLTLEQLSDVAGTNDYAPAGAVQAAIVASTPTVTYQFASQLVTIVLDGIAPIDAVTVQGAIFPGTTLYLNGIATSGSGDWFVSVISIANTSIPPNNQLTIRAILEPGSESNFLGLTGIVQNAFSATVVGTGPFGYVAIDAGSPSAGDLLIRSSTNENWTTGPNFPTFLQAGSGISVNYDATDSEWTVSSTGAGSVTSVTGTLPITVNNTNPTTPIVGIDTSGFVLGVTGSSPITVNNTDPTAPIVGVDTSGFVLDSLFTAKGDLLTATASSTPAVFPIGVTGQTLVVDLTTPTGLAWADAGSVYNGGEQIFGRSQVTNYFPNDQVRINFDNTQVSNISTLSYSNGVFTNTTGATRTYNFSLQASISFASSDWQEWYIWFQENSPGSFNNNARYGFAALKNAPVGATAVQATQWSFTLAPGENVSCWTMVPAAAGQYMFGSARGNNAPWATKVLVAEVPTLNNVGSFDNTIDARANAVFVSDNSNTRISWNNLDVNQIESLTLSNSNSTFTNTSANTRTYIIDFQAALDTGGPTLSQATVWVQSGSTRYAEKTFHNFNRATFALETSLSISLAPGEYFETYVFNYAGSGNCTINGAYSNDNSPPDFTIPSGNTGRLKIVDTYADGVLAPGFAEFTQSPTAYTAGANQRITWDTTVQNLLPSLSKTLDTGSGTWYFKNVSGETRTYAVSYSGAILCGSVFTEGDLWIQYNSINNSGSNRIGQTSLLNQNVTGFQGACVATVTLAPNEYFNTWIFANVAGTLSGSVYGVPAGQSCRLLIQELSAISTTGGTISGVVAGTGISGGGFAGTVTLNLDPSTTTTLGGVITGTGLSVAGDGTLSVSSSFQPQGTTNAIQYRGTSGFAAESAFSYEPSTNILTVDNITSNASTAFSISVPATSSPTGLGLNLSAGNSSAGTSPSARAGDVGISGGNSTSGGNGTRGGNVTLQGGFGALNDLVNQSGGDISLVGGNTLVGKGGSIKMLGGGPTGGSRGIGGDVIIAAGNGGFESTGGNVTIDAGTGPFGNGTVSISKISSAQATATYTPTNAVDLTTKAYVDQILNPVGTLDLAPSAPTTADTVGYLTQIYGGSSSGTGDGGDLVLDGGAPASTGAYGAVSIGLEASAVDLYLVSPNGTRYQLTVANDGTLGTVLVP